MQGITDKGIVATTEMEDGHTRVIIARAFHEGEPVDPYAAHLGVRDVTIEPPLQLRQEGRYHVSTEVVEVSSDLSAHVLIRLPNTTPDFSRRVIPA